MSWVTTDGRVIPGGYRVIGWDLDSSVRSTAHRRHLLPAIRAGEATWEDYSMLCSDDVPIPGAVKLMRMLENHYLHFAISGTSDKSLELTQGWCALHDVPFDDYLLRPADEPMETWKPRAITRVQKAGLEVELFVEDWEGTARLVAEQTGVPVLGVNPFDADAVLTTQDELAEVLATKGDTELGKTLARSVFTELKKRRL